MELPNALWMADIMDGPTLRLAERVLRTFLFATLDDCSRLVPHAQYYENEKLRCLLDCLQQAFACRGLPEKLYTDQGKIFTCSHLRVVCANLRIHLLHARPYAAWSKGKIERFFQTVQRDFEARLRLDPVPDLDCLNNRFWQWLESYTIAAPTPLWAASLQPDASRKRPPACASFPPTPTGNAFSWHGLPGRVRLDATISLEGNLWEVPVHLRGRQVELHYDPFDWSRVEVWYRERFTALARRCDKHLNAKITAFAIMNVENPGLSTALKTLWGAAEMPLALAAHSLTVIRHSRNSSADSPSSARLVPVASSTVPTGREKVICAPAF